MIVVAAWIGAGCSSDAAGPTREECARLREHVAELVTAQSATLSGAEQAKHRANLAATGGEEYLAACVKERSDDYVECALAAKSVEALASCGKRDEPLRESVTD